MFCKFTVPVPVVAGKISHQTTKSGTYILYVLSRQYDPAKKHTVPVRTMIGKMSDEEGKMFPNEKFFKFFPDTPLPELRPASERSSTLMAGAFLAIEEAVRHYDLDKMLTKHFGERAGLVLDLASYMVVEGRNQGQYYPDYAYRHPLFTKNMRIVSDSTVSKFLSEVTHDQITGSLTTGTTVAITSLASMFPTIRQTKTVRPETLILLNSARLKLILDCQFSTSD